MLSECIRACDVISHIPDVRSSVTAFTTAHFPIRAHLIQQPASVHHSNGFQLDTYQCRSCQYHDDDEKVVMMTTTTTTTMIMMMTMTIMVIVVMMT